MPYIKQKDRGKFSPFLGDIAHNIESLGELNYVITKLCHGYLEQVGNKYKNHAGIIGVLETLKLEFYRRMTAKHEDQKILENGDI